MKLACGIILLLVVIAAPATPSYASDTTYKHYGVNGKDALDILLAINQRGPKLHGNSAIATIAIDVDVDGKFVPQGNYCAVSGFKMRPKFVITLPKLKNETSLDGKTRNAWKLFYEKSKWHEEEHRRIWLDCIDKTERQLRPLRAKSCDALADRFAELYKASYDLCEKRHRLFDAKEEKRLEREPLVASALGQAKQIETKRKERIAAAPKMPDWFYNRR